MPRHLLLLLLSFAVVVGCAQKGEAPASVGTAGQGRAKPSEANRFLAYEHSIQLAKAPARPILIANVAGQCADRPRPAGVSV
jgi:hypothetical protein